MEAICQRLHYTIIIIIIIIVVVVVVVIIIIIIGSFHSIVCLLTVLPLSPDFT